MRKIISIAIGLITLISCRENPAFKEGDSKSKVDTIVAAKVINQAKVKGSDTIVMIDTSISGTRYKMFYSLAEYQKKSPAQFRVFLNIDKNSKVIRDTIESQSAGDTARLQTMMFVKDNKARNVKFYCNGNLIMFQLDMSWGQPLEELCVFRIEKNRIKLLTGKDGNDASILIENGFIINENNLKIIALEAYHENHTFNARIFSIGDRNLKNIRDIMIPGNEYSEDSVFYNASQQVHLCNKYLH
jgi:hypothetical protein